MTNLLKLYFIIDAKSTYAFIAVTIPNDYISFKNVIYSVRIEFILF